MSTQRYDVIIVGSGAGGAAAGEPRHPTVEGPEARRAVVQEAQRLRARAQVRPPEQRPGDRVVRDALEEADHTLRALLVGGVVAVLGAADGPDRLAV